MDLGTIGLRVETTGSEQAVQSVRDYVATINNAVGVATVYTERLTAMSNARERLGAKEIRDNFAFTNSYLSLARQRDAALAEEARAVEAAARQKEAAIAEEARAADQAAKQKAAALQNEIRENFAYTTSYIALARQRDAAIAEEARAAEQAARQKEAATAKQIRENFAFTNSYITLARQRDAALAEEVRKSDQAAKQKAAALDREAQEKKRATDLEIAQNDKIRSAYMQLIASTDPAIRANQQYARSYELIVAARGRDLITAEQEKQALIGIARQRDLASDHTNQYARDVRGAYQQIGFQVADFAVQMQSGTSFMVAFAQQGSQVLGMFGSWGAIAGAVLAITSALATIFFETAGAAQTLEDKVDDLNDSASHLKDSLSILKDDKLDQRFGSLTDDVYELTEAMLALDNAANLKNLRDALKAMVDANIEPTWWQSAANSIAAGQGAGMGNFAGGGMNVESLANQTRRENFAGLGFSEDLGYDDFQGYMEGIQKAAESGDRDAVVSKIKDFVKEAIPDIDTMNAALEGGGAAMLSTYTEAALTTAEIAANLNGSADAAKAAEAAAKEQAKAEEDAAKAAEKAAKTKSDNLDTAIALWDGLQNELDVANATARYGENSLHVSQLRAEQERAALNAKLIALGVEDDIRRNVLNTYDVLVRVESATAAAASEAARMRDEFAVIAGIVSGIVGAIASISLGNVGRQARLAVLERGGNEMEAAAAGAVAMEREKLAPVLGSGDAVVRAAAQEQLDNYIAAKNEEVVLETKINGIVAERRKADKAGGGGGRGKDDPLEKLRKQIALEEELTGLTEAQTRVYRALGESRNKYSEQEIANVVAEIEAIQRKQEILRQEQELADTIQSSMEDAFMSMVDGTKTVEEAFADMARAIISQLYQVLVVQQLVGKWDAASGTGSGIMGMLMGAFQADGGVWNNGSQVEKFANGGVVTSPTAFGMSGGRMGLMGEAGPEAIMPLKRGSDGKLGVAASGGGESYTVNNNINVTGSDAASVRNEVMKMIPQISEVTKSAVINARNRGGQMRNSFK